MSGSVIRLRTSINVNSPEMSSRVSIVDEDDTEYTIDTLFRVLFEASRRVEDRLYREEHDGTGKNRD